MAGTNADHEVQTPIFPCALRILTQRLPKGWMQAPSAGCRLLDDPVPRPGLVTDKMLDETIKWKPSCPGTTGPPGSCP